MNKYDVIVVGGGSAGVIASIASARTGAQTLLIESKHTFGGTNTNALVGPLVPFIGENKKQIVGGIPQEIIDDLKAIGGTKGHIDDPIDFAYAITPVDFKALQIIQANKIYAESNLEVVMGTSVMGVDTKDANIQGLSTVNEQGDTIYYYGKVIIDATGDADVTRFAKAPVNIGREGDGKSQPMTMCFNVGNVDLERIRDDVAAKPENFAISEEIASGERMTYVAISGYFDEVRQSTDFPIQRDRLLFFEGVQENEVGMNTTRILDKTSLDPQSLQEATIEGHKQVLQLFKWLKRNIPAFKNAYIKDVGDIGVRESVHIVGRKQLTELDVLSGAKQAKSLAVGAYPIDIHSPDSSVMEFLEENVVRNFEIDLDMCMSPSFDNLLVAGRPISATHAAHAASRVSVTCMALGQSLGIAAALAAQENVTPDQLDYEQLKAKIVSMGGIVDRNCSQ